MAIVAGLRKAKYSPNPLTNDNDDDENENILFDHNIHIYITDLQ